MAGLQAMSMHFARIFNLDEKLSIIFYDLHYTQSGHRITAELSN